MNAKAQTIRGNDLVTLADATLIRESEKAVCLEVNCSLASGGNFRKSVWFPKSKLETSEEGYTIPCWLLTEKERELSTRSRVRISARFGGHAIL